MKARMGENIAREWQNEIFSDQLWNALQTLKIDRRDGINELTGLTNKGSVLAMVYLGSALIKDSREIPENAVLGENWLTRSAELGSIEGEFILAYHLVEAGSIDAGIQSYENLSHKGYAPAQFALGHRYFTGDRLPNDIDKALFYFRAATDNGHYPSKRYLARIMTSQGGLRNKINGIFLRCQVFVSSFRTYLTYPNSDRVRV
jgi:TPR repeat protein